MSNYKVGEASWDEEEVQGGARRTPMPILKMSYGTAYTVRVISKPYCYYAKWVETASGKKLKLNSSLTPDCPLCQDGEQPKAGRYIKVLYRDGNKTEFRVLDAGHQIYNGIKKIQKIPQYGPNVQNYDITISKGQKGNNPLYSIVALPPTPFTEEDKAVAKKYNSKTLEDGKANPDYLDLEERCKPMEIEALRKLLAKLATPPDQQGSGKKASNLQQTEQGVFEESEESAPAAVVATPVAAPAAKAAPAKVTATAAAPAAKADKKDDSGFLDF